MAKHLIDNINSKGITKDQWSTISDAILASDPEGDMLKVLHDAHLDLSEQAVVDSLIEMDALPDNVTLKMLALYIKDNLKAYKLLETVKEARRQNIWKKKKGGTQ